MREPTEREIDAAARAIWGERSAFPYDPVRAGSCRREAASALRAAFALPEPFEKQIPPWVATAYQLAGAAMLASRFGAPFMAYIVMLTGSVWWAAIAFRRRQWPLMLLSLGFTVLNVIGIVRWWPHG